MAPHKARSAILLLPVEGIVPDDKTRELLPVASPMTISLLRMKAVWDTIRALPAKDRPNQVRHAFDLALVNLRGDEITLTRSDFAAEIGCRPREISAIMGTLERMGVVRRERRRMPGIKGRGVAVYCLNPHTAWIGGVELRTRAARAEVAELQGLVIPGQ